MLGIDGRVHIRASRLGVQGDALKWGEAGEIGKKAMNNLRTCSDGRPMVWYELSLRWSALISLILAVQLPWPADKE